MADVPTSQHDEQWAQNFFERYILDLLESLLLVRGSAPDRDDAVLRCSTSGTAATALSVSGSGCTGAEAGGALRGMMLTIERIKLNHRAMLSWSVSRGPGLVTFVLTRCNVRVTVISFSASAAGRK